MRLDNQTTTTMNYRLEVITIKGREVEALLRIDSDDNGNDCVRLDFINNEYFLGEEYGMPDRDAARDFIRLATKQFLKDRMISIAASYGEEAVF